MTSKSFSNAVDVNRQQGGRRNLIINGAMQVAQRGTASVTGNADFPVDRYKIQYSMDGAISAQQDSSAPAGFVNSTKITVTTADSSLGTSQFALFRHFIEGTNISNLAWGSASAKPITLSFWVRSSLTGKFGGSLNKSANNRSYPFSYTISATDTWEQKTVTIDGETSGTWLTTTGVGIRINWSLGAGTDFLAAAGSWVGAEELGATGQTNVLGTLNATWYITGVQLEVGTVATPFEHRSYGEELALCQRYYYRAIADGTINTFAPLGQGRYYGTNNAQLYFKFPVTMRIPSTAIESSNIVVNDATFSTFSLSSVALNESAEDGATITGTTTSGSTAGTATTFYSDGAAYAYVGFNSEL